MRIGEHVVRGEHKTGAAPAAAAGDAHDLHEPDDLRGADDPHGRANEEPGAAEHTHDESLPVAPDGKRGGKQNQDDIQKVAPHMPTL